MGVGVSLMRSCRGWSWWAGADPSQRGAGPRRSKGSGAAGEEQTLEKAWREPASDPSAEDIQGKSLVPGAMILPSNSLAALAARNPPRTLPIAKFPQNSLVFLCSALNPSCNMSPCPLKSPQTG